MIESTVGRDIIKACSLCRSLISVLAIPSALLLSLGTNFIVVNHSKRTLCVITLSLFLSSIPQTTYSIWPLVHSRRGEFLNPFYKHAEHWNMAAHSSYLVHNDDRIEDSVPNGIELSTFDDTIDQTQHTVDMLPAFLLSPQLFHLWSGLFLRWEWRLPNSDRCSLDSLCDLVRGTQTSIAHQRLLNMRISQLRKLLRKPVNDDPVQVSGSDTESEDNDSSSAESISYLTTADSILPTNAKDGNPMCVPNLLNGAVSTPIGQNAAVTMDTKTNPLPLLSARQLAIELDSVSVDWSQLSRRDVPCANCRTLLALTDHAVSEILEV
ncbi:unnamed protein product [Dicrocoelium dendriticum]|nr:unnamed protein product [Dicrocoelium dendriticum]